ncbi:DUF427 domain-containing protein [Scytonema sp. NUACC26]|uniref:DUF427 domain-containing protein n=1 Tax=Scytonema sp. NUACC26 TaxID=3140176 RepID=UPI0034DC2250
MKIPGLDHPITIEKNSKRVKITFNGQTIAETTRALELREATLPTVQYIPQEDVNINFLQPTNHSTHCPYKGDAGYYSIVVDGKTAENAIWYYSNPYPAVAQIKDHVAFYSNKVDSIEEI